MRSEGNIFKIVSTLGLHSARTLWSQLPKHVKYKTRILRTGHLPSLMKFTDGT